MPKRTEKEKLFSEFRKMKESEKILYEKHSPPSSPWAILAMIAIVIVLVVLVGVK